MGTGSFPGVKAAGAWRLPPTSFKCRGHERAELYLCSPSGTVWPATGWNLTLNLPLSNYQWACIMAMCNNLLFSRSLKLHCFVLESWKYEDCAWGGWSVAWISEFPDLKLAYRTKERSVKECDKALYFTVHPLRTQTILNYIYSARIAQ
jgi:hypothetical protein